MKSGLTFGNGTINGSEPQLRPLLFSPDNS